MKFSLLASLAIIAVTVAIALSQGKRLQDLQQDETELEERALALGLALDDSTVAKSGRDPSGRLDAREAGGKSSGPTAVVPAGGDDPEEIAREFAEELFTLAAKMKEVQETGGPPSMEMQKELFGFLARFMELDAEVIPHLIAEVRSTDRFEEHEKRGIMMMSFMTMAKNSPEAALNLYINSGDLLGGDAKQAVGGALGSWAAQDPRAALDWIDRHVADLPEDSVGDARKLAIANAFKSDPRFATEQTLDLEKSEVLQLSQQLGRILPTAQEHLKLLQDLQGTLGDLPSDPGKLNQEGLEAASKDQVLHAGLLIGLGGSLARQPFDSARELLDQADLSTVEKMAVAKGVAGNATELQNPGEWITWVDANSPASEREGATAGIIKDWTKKDFRSAAEWIGGQPQGSLRDEATYSFAQTVAPHEPASAADWALELPPSERRQGLLTEILSHWQKREPDAAAAFATEQGIPQAE